MNKKKSIYIDEEEVLTTKQQMALQTGLNPTRIPLPSTYTHTHVRKIIFMLQMSRRLENVKNLTYKR